jgi:hypothetical protein
VTTDEQKIRNVIRNFIHQHGIETFCLREILSHIKVVMLMDKVSTINKDLLTSLVLLEMQEYQRKSHFLVLTCTHTLVEEAGCYNS